jgi:hypothetical protein
MSYKYNRLPDTLFNVSVPLISTYSEEEMVIMGVPIAEHSNGRTACIDEAMTNVMLPITKIIDIYSTGAKIELPNTAQVTEIYKILERYLSESNSVTPELNAPGHVDDRDADIDRFADEMFNLNRSDIVNNTVNQKSGFDIGINKLAIPSANPRIRRRMSVMEAYASENPAVKSNIDSVYLTSLDNTVDPDSVVRKPRVRKRRKQKLGDIPDA